MAQGRTRLVIVLIFLACAVMITGGAGFVEWWNNNAPPASAVPAPQVSLTPAPGNLPGTSFNMSILGFYRTGDSVIVVFETSGIGGICHVMATYHLGPTDNKWHAVDSAQMDCDG